MQVHTGVGKFCAHCPRISREASGRLASAALACAILTYVAVLCDLWFIDGGHLPSVAASDLANARAMAARGAALVFDDVACDNDWFARRPEGLMVQTILHSPRRVRCAGPRAAWRRAVEEGAVVPWNRSRGAGAPPCGRATTMVECPVACADGDQQPAWTGCGPDCVVEIPGTAPGFSEAIGTFAV